MNSQLLKTTFKRCEYVMMCKPTGKPFDILIKNHKNVELNYVLTLYS